MGKKIKRKLEEPHVFVNFEKILIDKFDSNISVVSVLFFWMPSAINLAPSESILLPSKSKVVSEVFVSSNSFRYVHSALPISFDLRINVVQCVFFLRACTNWPVYSYAFILNSALFERSTEVVDASFAASFSMNCFGLGAPKRNLDMVGFLGCCGSRAAVVCGRAAVVCVARAAG